MYEASKRHYSFQFSLARSVQVLCPQPACEEFFQFSLARSAGLKAAPVTFTAPVTFNSLLRDQKWVNDNFGGIGKSFFQFSLARSVFNNNDYVTVTFTVDFQFSLARSAGRVSVSHLNPIYLFQFSLARSAKTISQPLSQNVITFQFSLARSVPRC